MKIPHKYWGSVIWKNRFFFGTYLIGTRSHLFALPAYRVLVCRITCLLAMLGFALACVNVAGSAPVYVYSVKYGHIPVARATLEVEKGVMLDGRPADRIVVKAKTRSYVSLLFFRVNNRYESYVDPDARHSLRFAWSIRQSNLSRTLIAVYDQNRHLARFSDGRSAPILENACDFFAALFYLSGRLMGEEGAFVVNLDVEGIPWRARTEMLGSEVIRSPWGKVRATETRTRFYTDHPDAERSRKTDVLTNRLVQRSTDLRIWFSDDDKGIPLKLTYRCSPFYIVAELREIEEDSEETDRKQR